MSNDIPTFNDICGTVTQALAETIINRNEIIAELREDLTIAQNLLHERCANIAELQKEIEGWRTECEAHEKDEKELYRLRESIRPLKTENIRLTAQRDQLQSDNARLKKRVAELEEEIKLDSDISDTTARENKGLRYRLIVAENLLRDVNAQCEILRSENENLKQDFGRGDAYWLAVTERDDARRRYCDLIHSLDGTKPEKIAKSNGWNDLYDSDNTPSLFEQKSDTDPATGVQYGDLPY